MRHFATIVLLCLFPHAKAEYCAQRHIGWTPGDKTKAIDDCDLLQNDMTVHFDRLTKRPRCLTQVKVKMTNPSASYPELNLKPKSDIGVHQKTITFTNMLSNTGDRCSSVNVEISTVVFSKGSKKYETHFSLNPEGCVDFEEHCSDLVNVDSMQSSTIKNDISGEQNEQIGEATYHPGIIAASLGGGLLVFIIILVSLAVWKKRTTQNIKNDIVHTDENHVYGTYSRGSMEDGEYGDGDVVEIIDTNVYYGQ